MLHPMHVQAAWLADKGIEHATHSQLRQTLALMQDSFEDFITAAQQAGRRFL